MRAITKFMRALALIGAALGLGAMPIPGSADNSPPDMTVCDGVTACEAPSTVCSAGFQVSLTNFDPATTNNSGTATYTYQICSPATGVCTGGTGLRAGEACLDDGFCQKKGQDSDPGATCNRTCSTDKFYDLSHFDVPFPALGGSCLTANTTVTGTCSANDNTPNDGHTASVGSFVLGDGSCFTSTSPVAKCDNTNLAPGDCVTMTLSIAGETNGLGLGNAVVVDKESNNCTASCTQGPNCTPCKTPPQGDGGACLTRTIGFWGTHPWITNNFTPVSVCGVDLGCNGGDDGKSNPSCGTGQCSDVMEGLGSIPSELKTNQPYVAMVKQLTAAKLNLAATGALLDGASCTDFVYNNKDIKGWIDYCESLCSADKQTITASGCIEALDAFNNSQDVGFVQTPSPFDQPPVDDHGVVSGADPSGFTGAQRDGVVVGKNVTGPGGKNCSAP
jgi:hypothetical protein